MFTVLKQYIRWQSVPILVAMLALMGVSLMSISAAENAAAHAAADKAARAVSEGNAPASTPRPAISGFTFKQAIFCGVALAGFIAAAAIPYGRLGPLSYIFFGVTLVLLVAVLYLPGNRDVHRWINLRFSGVGDGSTLLQFQPSELVKITYVLALAWYLRYRDNFRQLGGLVLPFVLTLVPAGLILMEPDLGTSLLLPPTLFFMLFMAGARLRHLLTILGLALIVVFVPVPQKSADMNADVLARRQSLAYWQGDFRGEHYVVSSGAMAFIQHRHQLDRIVGWLRQDDKTLREDIGLHLYRSMLAMGSGGWAGHDEEEDRDFALQALPEDHTDFIFAVIGCKWGFVGCIGVLLIYLVIFICGSEIAAQTYDPFGRLLVVGVLALLFTQIVINVGMTLGLMPITGMTLPLISYGGSSMLINGVALGLLVNVARRKTVSLGNLPFEFDA